MYCKGLLLSIVPFLLPVTLSNAQQQPKAFYEIVYNDSVVLYFNKDFSITEKGCFDYVRHTRINDTGDFNGYFEDRNTEGLLLGKGTYVNGIKQGYFEFYYLSGLLYCAGFYKNNEPFGMWEYFYESGVPERVVNVTDSGVLLLKHLSYTGEAKIQDGVGKFEGIIDGEMPTYVIGKVVNGVADGRWTIPGYNGSPLYTERFEHGELRKSSLISKRKMKSRLVAPKLNKFFLGNYLSLLEQFKYQTCAEAQQYHVSTNSVDAKHFTMYVRQRINNLIRMDVRFKQNEYYKIGDNLMTVQFSVNETGEPYDAKLITEWGDYFFESAANSLKRAVFSTRNKTMYFHLRFSFASGRYKYSIKFSRRNRRTKK